MHDSGMLSRTSVPHLVIRLWSHLAPRRKRQLTAILAVSVVTGLAEVVSLGAVLPFLGALAQPDRVVKFAFVRQAIQLFGLRSTHQLIYAMAAAFAAAALLAGALRMAVLWASTRVAYAIGADLSIEVYRRTLYQPYLVHVMRNSSSLISAITGKIGETVQVLNMSLTLFNGLILLVFIMTALFILNPLVASSAIIGFGLCYLLIMRFSRGKLRESSRLMSLEHTAIIKALQEGIGGIRDVQLDGTQAVYFDIFQRAEWSLRRAASTIVFVGSCPRFVMEALGMVLIAWLACLITDAQNSGAAALPLLGALAFGAQRLLPALQQIFHAWATIAGSQTPLSTTLELLAQPVDESALSAAPAPLPFNEVVRLDSVRFRYSESAPWVLDDFSMSIRKGARIGIVGATGSGKSTVLDLLMGLLTPNDGQLLVDGVPVTGARVRAWQRAIAHVPQSIFLADTSLAQNIAFGAPASGIDLDRVRQAAGRAQIADFIESRPEGYQAIVGERGIRLSGGQRQRIGIARALYKNASVMIFDEATSALDNVTEQSVMDAIDGLDRDLTIVLIAHRLSTVRSCDLIVELGDGKVLAQGTYEQLLEISPSFRNLASPAPPTC